MNDYTLGIQELDDAIGGIRKGSNIMLIGPSMSGKEAILYQMMYHGAAKENAIIIVATRDSATRILEHFREHDLKKVSSRIGIIDCVSKNIEGAVIDNENIKIASSPVDLTGIGVRISQFIDEFIMKKSLVKIQLHFDSLSTILMYSNIQTVYKFLHVFTGRIKAIGGLGVYSIESGMHNEQTISILKQLSDGIIEITSENNRNFIRLIGFSSKPTPYFEYEIVGADVRILGKK